MLTVGLTGGIGAGKSTVAALLVDHGAVLVDADTVAREVVEPGGPAYQPLVDRFGPAVLDADGRIDRPALAAVAFTDEQALADLNAITHPAIGVEMIRRKDAHADSDAIVIMDIPLLKDEHRQLLDLAAVVVVDVPFDLALERLVAARGMDEADATARMAAQPSREERLVGADLVVDNGGDLEQTRAEVDRVWADLVRRRDAAPAAG